MAKYVTDRKLVAAARALRALVACDDFEQLLNEERAWATVADVPTGVPDYEPLFDFSPRHAQKIAELLERIGRNR